MPRKAAPKDPFADVPEDFRNGIDAMDRDDIRRAIAQVALDQAELMEAKDQDTDLQTLQEQAREAGAIYRDGTKANRLKIKYAKQVLEGKGG
jgi:hypothetical protein